MVNGATKRGARCTIGRPDRISAATSLPGCTCVIRSAVTREMSSSKCGTGLSFRSVRGAWMKFVNSLRHGWNISPFHYRNHGADYGRVRVGMQVSPWPRSGHFPPSRVIVTRKKREIRLAGCSLAERGVLLRQRVAIFQQLRTHFWRRERQPQRAVLRCALPGLDIR